MLALALQRHPQIPLTSKIPFPKLYKLTIINFFMRARLIVLFFVCLTPSLKAQDSLLSQFIHQHSVPFRQITQQQFAGPGWDSLQKAVALSQFVLIGEEPHGVAEIPGITDAIAKVLKPKAFIAEISPYEAAQLNRLATQPGLPTAYQKQYPFSLSFYSWKEEFELIQHLHARFIPVIGIDQVYMGNAGHLLAEMAALARNLSVRAELQRQATAYLNHDHQVYIPGSTAHLYLSTRSTSAVDSLLSLTVKESARIQHMAHALATSYAISRTYQTHRLLPNGLSGHQTRVNLMKHNLLEQLEPYRNRSSHELPKLLFKFGSNHVGRDRALNSNIFDIGSLMSNVADAQNQASLHVLIVGKQGTQTVNDSFDPAKNTGPLTPQDNAYLQLFFEQTGNSWQLVDLRPARQALTRHQLLVQDPLLERTLLGYDYLVVIPTVTASGNY